MGVVKNYLVQFCVDFFILLNEMSPYLLLGLLFAGLFKVFLPQRFITKYFRKPNAKSVINATLLGVPMPLCSCGVLPTGISLYKNGASKGATNAFITSTPQTGIDSILVTYAMLGLPMAVIRPLVALVSGVFSGIVTNEITKNESHGKNMEEQQKVSCAGAPKSFFQKLVEVFRYAFYTFLSDIAKWLIIGMLVAALISVVFPDSFFTEYISGGALGILLILVISMPMYICATASVPIAAVLLSKGISPGAILVFLMAGPATNAASFTLIGKTLGKKSLLAYLTTIVGASIGFGLLIDATLPSEWFRIIDISQQHDHHGSEFLWWFQTLCTLLLTGFILFIYFEKYKQKYSPMNISLNKKAYNIPDVSCNHCKTTIEKTFNELNEVTSATVNLPKSILEIEGTISDTEVERIVKELGFTYNGRIS